MDKIIISASIVLFEEDLTVLQKTISSFIKIKETKKLYLIDNTEDSRYKGVFIDSDIQYIENRMNLGFGTAHNKVIPLIQNYSKCHLILNPDVSFEPKVITDLLKQLNYDETIAMIAPKVLFLDGRHQFSCRRYPKIIELFGRRFSLLKPILKKTVDFGEYKDKDLNKPFYCQYLTGCFQLYNTSDFIAINGFDERYFLYMEDVDICRKIDLIGKRKLYYPMVIISHILKQGSLRKVNLFFRHLFSALKYYKKWGFK